MQRTNRRHHSRAQSSARGLKRRNLPDELAPKCLIVAFIVFCCCCCRALPSSSLGAVRASHPQEISNESKPLDGASLNLELDSNGKRELDGAKRELTRDEPNGLAPDGPGGGLAQTESNSSRQLASTLASVAGANLGEPVISADNLTSGVQEGEPDSEQPVDERMVQWGQSRVESHPAGDRRQADESSSSSARRHLDETETDADAHQREPAETRGQPNSRLLLQLLILGFFVLLSATLIVVYSIKFCVCRRRKERRLLRRALIGDLSHARPLSHLPIYNQACQHVQQDDGALSFLSLGQPGNGLEFSPAECGACSHCRRSFLAGLDDGDTNYQLEANLATRPRSCAEFTPAQMYANQPQLVLALLERLQHLLTSTEPTPTSATSARRALQLGHLITAQMGSLPAPHSNPSLVVPSVSQTVGVCGCQQAPSSLMSLSSSRPPAYSELFLVDGGSSEEVTHEQLTRRRQAGEHELGDTQQERPQRRRHQTQQQQHKADEQEREHEQQEAALSSERTHSRALEETTTTSSRA